MAGQTPKDLFPFLVLYPSSEGQTVSSATRWRAGVPGMQPVLECSSRACAKDSIHSSASIRGDL